MLCLTLLLNYHHVLVLCTICKVILLSSSFLGGIVQCLVIFWILGFPSTFYYYNIALYIYEYTIHIEIMDAHSSRDIIPLLPSTISYSIFPLFYLPNLSNFIIFSPSPIVPYLSSLPFKSCLSLLTLF